MRIVPKDFDLGPAEGLKRLAQAAVLAALVLVGCAKQPATGIAGTTRVIFTLKVDGRLRDGSAPEDAGVPYIYMVALRLSELDNPTDQGPIPVIAPPWGNGFVAGQATHFVWWDPTAANPYTVYRFQDALLNNYVAIGLPVNSVSVPSGGNTLQFELSLDQLQGVLPSGSAPRSLQVNFLTMDRLGTTQGSKLWDALGDGRTAQVNQPITIPLRTSGLYNNERAGQIEPRGDQPNPDLDIVDWSVQVRID